MTAPPRVLFVSSTDWVWPATLAGSFAAVGINVACCARHGTPLLQAAPAAHRHTLSYATPLRSLRHAIEAAEVHAIIPCDDRAVWQLKRIYLSPDRYCGDPRRVQNLIRHSIGPAIISEPFIERSALLELARDEGVAIPDSMALRSDDDLRRWGARAGYPAFLKADGTFGGQGVTEVGDHGAAQRAFALHRSSARLAKDVARVIFRRDGSEFWDWVQGRERSISIQAAVVGRPANILVACDRGSVLAATSAEVLATLHRNGPASSIRIIENEDMAEAARLITRRLGLSGFVGFDFMIEAATGRAYLIEMNPRVTPLSQIAVAQAPDPVLRYCEAILGVSIAPRPTVSDTVITLARTPGKASAPQNELSAAV